MEQRNIELLSGRDFVEFVVVQLKKRNKGLNRLSESRLSRNAGFADQYFSRLRAKSHPNPSAIAMRCLLLTLGFQIKDPQSDVIPFLKSKGVYDPEIHGVHEGLVHDA